MSEEPTAEVVSRFLVGTGVAIASTLFLAAGFLATRAYLGALGVPEHVAIPIDGYIQYGARFFFVFIVQLFPAIVCAAVLFLFAALLTGRAKRLDEKLQAGMSICVLVIGGTLIAIFLELLSLTSDPVFSPGRVRNVSHNLRLQLYGAEVAVVITTLVLAWTFPQLWRSLRNSVLQKCLLSAAVLLALTAILLLPLCFGQIAMIPQTFNQVTLVRDRSESSLSGILVFSDAANYFLFTNDRMMVEISHAAVKEIHYEGRKPLSSLVTP